MPKNKTLSEITEIEKVRHTLSHILAHAVLKIYPKTKLGIGPAIENGYYYDFDFEQPITEEILPKIEKEMMDIIQRDLPIKQVFKTKKETIELLKNSEQIYKLDLVKEIPDEEFSFYVTGEDEFIDLCRGPHIKSTGEIKAFKLTKIAGAYWRGKEDNKMLTRIYGIAFKTTKEMKKHEERVEEAMRRDHRKIGKNLDLFSFHEEGPGFVFWHPRGLKIRNKLIDYWRQLHEREGYTEIKTPTMLTLETWKRSGHLDTFLDKMYLATTNNSEQIDYAIKPMNCDGGMLIYKTKQVSYKDLPIRMGEIGTVHRYESSGELHGLMRVREITQDDAHIYCTEKQMETELKDVIKLCNEVYKTFNLEFDHIELSTRPEKSIGSDQIWEKAEETMKKVLKEGKIDHEINEGDGAFYGPKFDFHLRDCLGKTWQCATIQLDFAQPENFDLTYINEKGEKARPVMIHRTIYGAIERFLGIILENYAGKLPIWLAPEQITIIPIAERHLEYAQDIAGKIKSKDIVVNINYDNDTMQSRIRETEIMKTPYILVVGDKEEETKTVSVRPVGKKDLGIMKLEEFMKILKEDLINKK